MIINYKKYLLSYLFAISTFFSPLEQAISSVPDVISGEINITSGLIKKYSAAYPEIHFINLVGIAGYNELKTLPLQLGNNASNVDYEHPPEVRQLLLDAQMERIAQMIIAEHAQADWQAVDSLTDTERAAGGFGSTGTK